jgi:soluble lytic murein transglycosylase-like protein
VNVDPTAFQSVPTGLPLYQPEGVPLGGNEEQEGPEELQDMPQTSTAGSFASINSQFSALINGLSQQLKALESQLMQALNQLNTANTPVAPPKGKGGKPVAPPSGNATKPGAPPGGNTGKPVATPDPGGASGCGNAAPGAGGRPLYHRYGKIITDVCRRRQMDPLLVSAVIRQESGFQPNAVSKTGAQGLMQLMPDTARSLGVRDAFDPKQNIEGGATLLQQLMDRYHGQLDLALAAYNAGPGAVDKYGGVPPYPETQAYVRNVMATYRETALSA